MSLTLAFERERDAVLRCALDDAVHLHAAFDLACFAVAGFTTAGFVAAGFLAPGFLPAGFAATMSLGGAELEAARTSEASGDAAFGVAFTVSSLGPSLGSACSALGRRG